MATNRTPGMMVRGNIIQPTHYFRTTLGVEINGSGRRLLSTIEVREGKTNFSWSVPFEVNSVILDPHYKVLRWLPDFRDRPAP